MRNIKLIDNRSDTVYQSMKHAAECYNMGIDAFRRKFLGGGFEELSRYNSRAPDPMVFSETPKGRIEIKYGKIKKIFPFRSISALNQILETVPIIESNAHGKIETYIYLKSNK